MDLTLSRSVRCLGSRLAPHVVVEATSFGTSYYIQAFQQLRDAQTGSGGGRSLTCRLLFT